MVKVRAEQPRADDGQVDLERWLDRFLVEQPGYCADRIRAVAELSAQAEAKAVATNAVWDEARSSFSTGLEMAEILASMRVDEDGVVAAIIYRAVRENQLTLNHVRKQFGDSTARIVEGALRMAAISNVQLDYSSPVLGQKRDQGEQARRLLISIVDDVRVALLKLAERTCAMRAVAKSPPAKRIRLTREITSVYLPLAQRLGIGHLKWELEDLAFRYTEPLTYKRIAGLLDEKRADRQGYIDRVIALLNKHLKQIGIDAIVEGRPKHIYSIWRKMQEKKIPFSQVYDVRAVRIQVQNPRECYSALGVVHSLWRNIRDEFDDYIAAPKDNGYRSLHTAVVGPEDKVLEVQIRTRDMHEEAEFGICAHWRYKTTPTGDEPDTFADEKINWLRQIVDWQDEMGDLSELGRELLADVDQDRIYVFTPEGHVVDMNTRSTPVDFAYHVHTEVGHCCRGAKVNGRVVPLNTQLKSGDRVEVITGDDPSPQREWLYPHLGYVTSSRAKVKIRNWLGRRARKKNIADGKRLLVDELDKLGLEPDLDELLAFVEYETLDDLYRALGSGEVEAVDIVDLIEPMVDLQSALFDQLSVVVPGESIVKGMGALEYTVAGCCQPVRGDSIAGVVDQQEHVHIHRADCLSALRADVEHRLIQVEWDEAVSTSFPVSVEIDAYDRKGLLYEICGVLMEGDVNVEKIIHDADRRTNKILLQLKIEITSINELLKILEKIGRLPNVVSARRTATLL